jgi:hypothetical protein
MRGDHFCAPTCTLPGALPNELHSLQHKSRPSKGLQEARVYLKNNYISTCFEL